MRRLVILPKLIAVALVILATTAVPGFADDSLPANPSTTPGVEVGTDIDSADPQWVAGAAQPAAVIGEDERIRITDTTAHPASAVAYLELYDTFGFPSGSCSGTFIGTDTVLTAAHCLYDEVTGWTGDIRVVPGKNGPSEPLGSDWAETWGVQDEWIDNGSYLWDYGVIKMPNSDLGDAAGLLPLVVATTETLSRSDFLPAIFGYPGDKPDGTMWLGAQGNFSAVNQFTLEYLIDTAAGQSGAAIISINEAITPGVVGVHSGALPSFNRGARVDILLLTDILELCVEMVCDIEWLIESDASPTPTSTSTAPPPPPPAGESVVWGDSNCSGSANPIDSLLTLRYDAGLSANTGQCPNFGEVVEVAFASPHIWGDPDCSGEVNPIDSLKLLRNDAGLTVNQPSGCPDIGQEVFIGGPPPTPTAAPTNAPTPVPTATATPTLAPTATAVATATATPTLAPTATAVATATATPGATATATPPPSGQVYADNSSWYESITGSLWVVGEVHNGLSQSVDFVKVTANFYSASNQLLATDYGYSCLDALAPGGTSPFSVLLIGPPAGVDHVSVQVTNYYSPPLLYEPPPGLSSTIDNTYYNIIDSLHVVGTVTNNAGFAHEFVKVCAAYYNASGTVVRTSFSYASPDTLSSGQTGTYDTFTSSAAGLGITDVSVWPDASYP